MIGSCVGMSLINLFELSVPLIQAPMAGVATPLLAAAVSEAGALWARPTRPVHER
jgi:nitronate monooxygenase